MKLHYLLVVLGLAIGLVLGMQIQTQPPFLGWLFGIGGGLAGGAFLAAIFTGEALAGGARGSSRRGAPGRPAWFDEPDEPAPPAEDPRPHSDN